MINTDDQVIQAEITLEEKIIYDKLTGRLPIHRAGADVTKEMEPELAAAPDGTVNGQMASVEERSAQYVAEICQRLETMESTRENMAFRPIYSCRRFIGWLIVFFKRVVRKCLKWYLEPVCFQQTDFNNAVTPAIGRLTELQRFSLERFQRIEGELVAKETELGRLRGEMQDHIDAQINSLKHPVESELAVISENYAVLMDAFKEMEQNYAQLFQEQGEIQDHIDTQINSLKHPVESELAVISENYAVLMDAFKEMERKYAQLFQEQADKIQQQEKISAMHSGYIEQLTVEHNDRLDALADRLHQSEQMSQTHSGSIERLTVEHNRRLATLEDHFSSLENHYSVRMGAAEKLLQELEDEGAFVSSNLEQQIRRSSLSQSGEDAILAYIFMVLGISESQCSYLDLGANHAQQLSNTYYFYQKGSRGVLVEANPKLIAELKFYRSGDVILNRCIAGESGQSVDFYIMSGDGLSTPDKEQAEKIVAYNPAIQIENIVTVQTITVNEILDTYFDGAPVFINIDIEGAEMEILASIDFEAHRPLAIILEMIPYRSHLVVGVKNQKILQFMADNDYVEYAFTGINSIFLDKKHMKSLGVLE